MAEGGQDRAGDHQRDMQRLEAVDNQARHQTAGEYR